MQNPPFYPMLLKNPPNSNTSNWKMLLKHPLIKLPAIPSKWPDISLLVAFKNRRILSGNTPSISNSRVCCSDFLTSSIEQMLINMNKSFLTNLCKLREYDLIDNFLSIICWQTSCHYFSSFFLAFVILLPSMQLTGRKIMFHKNGLLIPDGSTLMHFLLLLVQLNTTPFLLVLILILNEQHLCLLIKDQEILPRHLMIYLIRIEEMINSTISIVIMEMMKYLFKTNWIFFVFSHPVIWHYRTLGFFSFFLGIAWFLLSHLTLIIIHGIDLDWNIH